MVGGDLGTVVAGLDCHVRDTAWNTFPVGRRVCQWRVEGLGEVLHRPKGGLHNVPRDVRPACTPTVHQYLACYSMPGTTPVIVAHHSWSRSVPPQGQRTGLPLPLPAAGLRSDSQPLHTREIAACEHSSRLLLGGCWAGRGDSPLSCAESFISSDVLLAVGRQALSCYVVS